MLNWFGWQREYETSDRSPTAAAVCSTHPKIYALSPLDIHYPFPQSHMTWHGVEGHDRIIDQFRRAISRHRLASSFLFTGPSGIGKRTFALKLAQSLLCRTNTEELLDPCEKCPSCLQAAAGTHPDVNVVSKPEDKSFIPLQLFIGDDEHRGREGLCHNISLKPFMGGRKIAIIDDADYLNPEGANCLLKTLEEPPPQSVLILIGTSPAKQLPTIRSRCQLIRFRPLSEATVAELLVSRGLVSNPEDARRLASYSGGSIQRAVELGDPAILEFRTTLYQHLALPELDSVRFAPAVSAFVDAAGKEAPPRRARLRQVLSFTAEFYRRLLHANNGIHDFSDADLARAVQEALSRRQADDEVISARLNRTLEAAEQIDRNANQSTLIEAWLDDLAGN
jgi:DNA polymerase III subunit delta'